MDTFVEIVKFLGGTSILLLAVAWLIRTLTKALLDKDLKAFEAELKVNADSKLESLRTEMRKKAESELEILRHGLQRERDAEARGAQDERARDERIREEILRLANPILGSVGALKRRLQNILIHDGYLALQRTPQRPIDPNWSVSYDYFVPSTLYLFCSYFYWVVRLQSELSFELFRGQVDKDEFLAEVHKVSDALGRWPPPYQCTGRDVQVFALQQRALGEAVSVREDGGRCLGYDEFFESWEDSPLADHLAPLHALLDELSDDGSCRWKRLVAVLHAVEGLEVHCASILQKSNKTNSTSADAVGGTP